MASPARTTIHSLPDELITEIAFMIYHSVHPMMHSSFKSGDTFDTWGFLSLMRVCHGWRELIAAEGRLWTFIDIANEKMALLTLKRSQRTLLTVTAGLGGIRHPVSKSVVDAICNIPERIEDLSVTENIQRDPMTALMKMVERNAMKNLRKLHLTGPIGSGIFNPFFTTPCLENLGISRLLLKTWPGCFSNLIHLRLRMGPDAFSMDTFLNAFGPRNRLESLDLYVTKRWAGSIHTPNALLPPTPLEFPSLQSLDISMQRTPDIFNFFKRVSNPQPINNLSISIHTSSPVSDIVPEASMAIFSFPTERDALVEISLAILHKSTVTAIDLELGDSCWAKKLIWENGRDSPTPAHFLRDAARLTGSPQVKFLCINASRPVDSLTLVESFSQLLAAYPDVKGIEAHDTEHAIIALGTLYTLPAGRPQALCPGLAELQVKMYITRRENYRAALENLAITVEARADSFPLRKLRIYHRDGEDFKLTDEYVQRLADCGGVKELHVYTRKLDSAGESASKDVKEGECDGMIVCKYA